MSHTRHLFIERNFHDEKPDPRVAGGPESFIDLYDPDWPISFVVLARQLGKYRVFAIGAGMRRAGRGAAALEEEIDALYAKLKKPISISEFGAESVAGLHSDPPEMWTEEYQAAMLRAYLDVADRKPFVASLHVWSFADFKTGQSIMRTGGMNLKGVFTRDRRPKMAAHFLRERWQSSGASPGWYRITFPMRP